MVGSLLELLAERESVAAGQVEALREQIAVLTRALCEAEESLSRLRITRETIGEVLAGVDAAGGPLSQYAGPQVGAAVVAAGAPSPAVQVGFWHEGADPETLPLAYRDVVEVLEDSGEPMRAGQVGAALGLGSEARHREGMRSKLRRLTERGWCVADADGLFALAPGVSGRNG